MIQAHQKRQQCYEAEGIKRYFQLSYLLSPGTKTVLLLMLFLILQVLLQLTFKGHFRYLVAHMPESAQNMFK